MKQSMPDYLLIAELLGFGTGTVLSVLLVLLIWRTAYRSPGTPLLGFCALLWNVFGLIENLLILGGLPMRAPSVVLVRAAYLSGGAMFPISFLQLWSQPTTPGTWHSRAGRWLVAAAKLNALWIAALLFACPYLANQTVLRFTSHAVAWNASFLMTAGALLLVRSRLRVTSDRIYLALTLVGAWGSTVSIYLLENFQVSPELESVLAIAREQSPFLAVLGAMFFFANFRSSDLLIKHSLRVVAAVSIGVWTWFFLSGTLPGLALKLGAFPEVSRVVLVGGLIASLLLVFYVLARLIGDVVDAWILRQPDFRFTLQRLWNRLAQIDSGAELFAAAEGIICAALDVSAARVLGREEIPGIESQAAANAGRSWELACCDAGRRLLPELDVDVLVPIRVHGEVAHVMAVAPGRFRRSLLTSEIDFLENAAGQIGSRLEAMAHEQEKMERQSREATLRELAAQAELKALRAQVNPHFLFNSLNTIADLIVTDPEKAEAMTVLLAKVFRHVLMHSDQQFSRVSDEMAFLETYLGIEQVRFGARLRVSMEMDPTVSQTRIPSLILQPIVENAIKHGLAPKVGQGHLSITAASDGEFVRLAVEDDGVGNKAAAPASAASGNSNAPMLDVAGFFSDPQTLRPAAAALNDNLPQSLTPAVYGAPAGSGSGATFAFTFTDPKGWQDLGVVNVLFNNFLDGRQACYIAYSRPLKLLYLVNDKGDALLPGIALGGAGSVNNSQCAIAGTNSSAVGTGNTLVLRLSITFTSSFAGNKVTYLAVRDVAESNSGWQPAGVWLVSGAPDSTTAVSGAAPNWGAGHTQTLTYTFADTKGWQDLGVVNILINSALNGSQACYLAYSRPLNTLYLVNDRGNGLLPGLSLSGSGTLSNGQCSVNAAGSSAAGSGNTLTLALNVTFSASFSGYKIVYLAARDGNDANNTGWQSSACWTAE